MVKIVCWNIAKKSQPWGELLEMGADVALLQEADPAKAPANVAISPFQPQRYQGLSRWPLVVKLSNKVKVDWFRPVNAAQAIIAGDEIAVSDSYTVAVARVTPLAGQQPSGEPFVVFSMYARWLCPHPSAKQTAPRKRGASKISIYSDASTHRIISDMAAFVGHTNPASHRILAAGDLNTIYEETVYSLQPRDTTVFERMEALGLEFIGPRWPYADRQADPVPKGLPQGSENVPTYLSAPQHKLMRSGAAHTGHQLDYVFASKGFDQDVSVRAMNAPEHWGSSDHCRILIDVQ